VKKCNSAAADRANHEQNDGSRREDAGRQLQRARIGRGPRRLPEIQGQQHQQGGGGERQERTAAIAWPSGDGISGAGSGDAGASPGRWRENWPGS